MQTATLSGNNWSIDSSQFVTAMSNGTVTFNVTATDDQGNSATERVFFINDITPAVMTFTTPQDGTTMNGDWPLAGSVSDNSSGVKALYIGYFTSTPSFSLTTEAELEAKSTTEIDEVTKDTGKPLLK